VHGFSQTDLENVSAVLVVYENTLPDARATRKALRLGRSRPHGESAASRRHRRGVGNKLHRDNPYCRLYKWSVNFRVLNWTWIVAPHYFEAGYCAGRCPRGKEDLDRANLTNHAFLRLVHRAWGVNAADRFLPEPSCVSVRFSPMHMLYRTDESTFELRTINEMVSTACGCL